MDRIPPHSIEAEQAVLGAAIAYPGAIDRVADMLTPDDFYRHDHQAIWRVAAGMAARGREVDVLTVADQLDGEIDGLRGYLGQLAVDAPAQTNIKAHARLIRDKSRRRQMIRVAMEMQQEAWQAEDAAHALDAAQIALMEIGAEAGRSGPMKIGESIGAVAAEMERRRKEPGGITGLSTGYSDLDDRTTGLHPGNLAVVAGRPGMGKTAFAMGPLASCAAQGKTALIFSMEMSREEITERAIAYRSGIPLTAIRAADLTMDQEDEWHRCAGLIRDWPVVIDDTPALKIAQIRTRARRVKTRHGLALVVVDYLSLAQGEGENRTNQVGDISRGLKALAKELHVPVIALSQLNRGVESRADKRPVLSDLRESGQVEQDADLIVFLYRHCVYDETAGNVAHVVIAKQRNGKAPDTFPMVFWPETAQYVDAMPGTRLPDVGNVTQLRKAAGGFEDV